MSLRRIALLGVLSLACLAVAACVDIDPAYEAFSRLLEQRAAGLQSKAPASNQRTGGSAPVGSSLIPDPAAPPAANSTAAPKGGSNVRTAATADVHPCGNGVCDAGETCSTCPQDCTQGDGSPCNRVGIFYSGWHWPAWAATEIGRRLGRRAYSVEDVLRSQTGTIGSKLIGTSFEKIYNAAQLETSLGFYWHHRPLQNFYCIYHARQPSELLYNAAHEGTWGAGSGPDCANWQARVQDHAQQLVATGIDYVTMDATNLDQHDAFSDAIQLRPFQVLLEEFSRLRLAGIQTPDLAMWQRLPTLPLRLTNINVTNYGFAYVMVLYNVPEYQSLILRDPVTKKKIFFYPSVADVDLNIIKYIEANGGLNDIVVQPMWVGQQKSGGWNFFAFCKNIVLESNTACAQPATPESSKVTGSQLAVSPSYQATFASVQFQAIGQNSGITLKKQWATAFTVKPDWVFLTGWNEHVAQPQDSQGLGNSMGFEYDPGFVGKAFVDIHGAAFGRDIEPTVEGGSEMMDITASCIRVFRRAVALSSTWCPPTELCCKGELATPTLLSSDSCAPLLPPHSGLTVLLLHRLQTINLAE